MKKLFKNFKPIIGCIHLKPLPGAPLYDGNMPLVFQEALEELYILEKAGFHGVIVENFRDMPFYPGRLPSETVAAMSAVCREIVSRASIPVGINMLRNDAEAAIAVATAVCAQFVRVNIHMHVFITDQGIIEGNSFRTIRLKKTIMSDVRIFADVSVKHAMPLADYPVKQEVLDLVERGLVDSLIVTGPATGHSADLEQIKEVKSATDAPVIIGSGITPDNLHLFMEHVDGVIIGSWLKKDGKAFNRLDRDRAEFFMRRYRDGGFGKSTDSS